MVQPKCRFLAFITILVTILLSINFNQFDLSFTNPFWVWVWNALAYSIKIPVFTFVIIFIIGVAYWWRLKNRYASKKISLDFLIGHWKNEWNSPNSTGSEECEIREDGKYYIIGQHWFDLKEFEYDPSTNKITFWKTAVQPDDTRKVLNTLNVVINDLLIGEEAGHQIKYTKLYIDK